MAMRQVGIVAARAPDGSFLPAVPIYKEVGEVAQNGMTETEQKACDSLVEDLLETFAAAAREHEALAKQGIKGA